jgi:hypothetical protein
MGGMESWEPAAPQKCTHTSGNITAAEGEKLQVTKPIIAKLTQKYEKNFRFRLEEFVPMTFFNIQY